MDRTFDVFLRNWGSEKVNDDINHCLADMRDAFGLDCKIRFSAVIHSIKVDDLESFTFKKHIDRASLARKILKELERRNDSFYVSFTVHAT